MSSDTEKEEIILDAAMLVFIEKGWHGAKMQEIADRAGINKALLHYYFRNKERLYTRIFERVFRTFFMQFRQFYRDDVPFEEFLEVFVDRYMEVLKTNQQIPLFILRELSEGGNRAQSILKDLSYQMDEWLPPRLLDMIENEKQSGRIADIDPLQFAITLIGSTIYFFIAEPIINTIFHNTADFDRNAFIDQRKKEIFKVLYYGIKPRGVNQ